MILPFLFVSAKVVGAIVPKKECPAVVDCYFIMYYSTNLNPYFNNKGTEITEMWNIEYWVGKSNKSSVEKWLDSLTQDQLKSVAKELKLLELCGNELKLPHSKSLGKSLFELRERRYGYRIYYIFYHNKIIILLGAGNKKTQQKDIKIARERLVKLTKEER